MKRAVISLFAGTAVIAAIAASGAIAAGPEAPSSGKKVWMSTGSERDEALKLTPNAENGKDVYEVCTACHMPEGWGLTDGTFPQVAGQHRTVIIKQLEDIREGNRDNPTMYPFAKPSEIGGAQAVADVAEYIARNLKMNPKPGYGPGTDLELGKKLYADNCVRCHGAGGEGDAEKYYPRIQAQHYAYLLRQYQWIKEGKRRNANPDMVEQIKNFTDRDTQAVLDYVSRLPAPPDLVGAADWKNPDFK
ncbi:MAG: c-type cytochrome [Xanthobacteraceae bacterium]|nr:MAG: c-type cytochrome [Xanthobacteraceae bacterium]